MVCELCRGLGNAGGAWTPIGDVTTTMLWIQDKVTTLGLIEHLALPSIVCAVIPLALAGFIPVMKGPLRLESGRERAKQDVLSSSKVMLIAGVSGLIFGACVQGFNRTATLYGNDAVTVGDLASQ